MRAPESRQPRADSPAPKPQPGFSEAQSRGSRLSGDAGSREPTAESRQPRAEAAAGILRSAIAVTQEAWSGSEDRRIARCGGKSELQRAAGWITSRRGDATESATERYRPSPFARRR